MTEDEALARAQAVARRHFDHRVDASPRVRQGFILREQARLLSRPVPGWLDLPRSPRPEILEPVEPEQDLAALLEASLKQRARR